MKPKSHLRFYTNLFLTSALAIGGSFSLAKLALAAGTGADQTISNTATGSFEGSTSGATGNVISNTVTLSVLEVAGITVVPKGTPTEATTAELGLDGITPGPYQNREGINNGDIVYYDFTITNTGNSPTAIFIPNVVTIGGTNGTSSGTLERIKVIAVDPDGALASPSIAINAAGGGTTVPAGGAITTDAAFLGTSNGYIPVNGTVTVRVAVKITGVQVGNTTTVVLGDTGANDNTAGTQNQDWVVSNAPIRDVYTSDLANATANPYPLATFPTVDQTAETNGSPVNGDAVNFRKEASALLSASIAAGIDYGDAPNTFKTVLNSATGYSGSGASHIIDNTIKMGTAVTDAEADGVAAAALADAVGDDAAGTDDEDGVTLPTLLTSATTYTATVNVTNNSGSPAYLVGWIDFNKNGTFDAGEAQVFDQTSNTSTAVPTTNGIVTITPIPTSATASSKTLTWSIPAGLVTGDVLYARFRLTTDLSVIGNATVASIVPQPQTPLGKGEVEDYRITVGAAVPSLNVVKRITNIAGVDITTFNPSTVNLTSNPADPKWPLPNTTYLRGGVDCIASGGTCNGVTGARPTEVVEYTIYFLANGNDNLRNVKICDAIPANTTYVPGSMVLGWDSTNTNLPNPSAAIGLGETILSDVADADIGRFLTIGTIDAVNAPTNSACQTGANLTGAIFVNFGATPVIPFATANGASGAASPNSAYGFIRFKVTVK